MIAGFKKMTYMMKSPLPIRNIIRRGIAANVSAMYAFSTPTF